MTMAMVGSGAVAAADVAVPARVMFVVVEAIGQ
jgi:hypothetical protein